MRRDPRLLLLAIPAVLEACGSVYDTNQSAPSAWVSTYNQPSGAGTEITSTTRGTEIGSVSPAPGDAEARLREAAQLRDDGLISETEYHRLRKRILGSL